MKHWYILASAAILLSGCSIKSDTGAADPLQREAGNWQMVHYVTVFEATGIEGGMADMVAAGQASIGKKDIGGPVCLDAAETAKDNLETRLKEAIIFGPEWKVTKSEFSGGKVDFQAVMDDPAQGQGTLTITGSLSAIASDLLITSDVKQPAPGKGRIHTVMKQENTRVGDCSSS